MSQFSHHAQDSYFRNISPRAIPEFNCFDLADGTKFGNDRFFLVLPPDEPEDLHITYPACAMDNTDTLRINAIHWPLGAAPDYDRFLFTMGNAFAMRQSKNHCLRVEFLGLINEQFLSWVRGNNPLEQGPVSAVELVSLLPLPSGRMFPLILKGSNRSKLQPISDSNVYTTDEQEFIVALTRHIRIASVTGHLPIVTEYQKGYFPRNQQHLIGHPELITSEGLKNEFETAFFNSISRSIRDYSGITDCSQGSVPHEILDYKEYSTYLKDIVQSVPHHPRNPRPSFYCLGSDEIEEFVNLYGPRLFEHHNYYQEHRRTEASCLERSIAREQLGYSGPLCGFELSIEIQVMDMIYDFKKNKNPITGTADRFDSYRHHRAGRSYDIEFPTVDQLASILNSSPIRRELVCRFFQSHGEEQRVVKGAGNVFKLFDSWSKDLFLRLDNIMLGIQHNDHSSFRIPFHRILEGSRDDALFINALTDWMSDDHLLERLLDPYLDGSLQIPASKLPEINRQVVTAFDKHLSKELSDLAIEETEISRINWGNKDSSGAGIVGRIKQWEKSIRSSTDSELKEKMLLGLFYAKHRLWFDLQCSMLPAVLLPDDTVETLMNANSSLILDRAITKFIYTINSEGEVYITHEHCDKKARVAIRPTHSQLNAGRAAYGAGELIFGSHNEQFQFTNDWIAFLRRGGHTGRMRLLEINNLTGHYLCNGDETLRYAARLILPSLEAQGVDVSHAYIEDRLKTGIMFSALSID